VKTREAASEMLKFFDELTTQTRCTRRSAASEDEDSRKRRSSVRRSDTVLLRVEQTARKWTSHDAGAA
jgi:hypothetical protein